MAARVRTLSGLLHRPSELISLRLRADEAPGSLPGALYTRPRTPHSPAHLIMRQPSTPPPTWQRRRRRTRTTTHANPSLPFERISPSMLS